MQENLSEFYSWVDNNIEIMLGRQKYLIHHRLIG